jgi:hypothetical protein
MLVFTHIAAGPSQGAQQPLTVSREGWLLEILTKYREGKRDLREEDYPDSQKLHPKNHETVGNGQWNGCSSTGYRGSSGVARMRLGTNGTYGIRGRRNREN